MVTKGIDDLWQMDLVEMIPYAKENKNFKYLLTIIDTFSKYAWVKPILNKDSSSICVAVENIFIETKRIPKHIQTDHGKEFYNKTLVIISHICYFLFLLIQDVYSFI